MESNKIYLLFKPVEGPIFVIREYYHFFFAVFIPFFEFYLKNPTLDFAIVSNIGNMQNKFYDLFRLLFPNISLSFETNDIWLYPEFLSFDIIKNVQQTLIPYKVPLLETDNKYINNLLLPAYDVFLGDLYFDTSTKPFTKKIRRKIIQLLNNYIKQYPNAYHFLKYDVIYIRRHILTANELKNKNTMRYKYRRSIQNSLEFEKELCSLCEKVGFSYRTIILEDYSLLEQFYLFSNAKIVIGQHGAGLTNIFFMSKNTYVVEILGKETYYCDNPPIQLSKKNKHIVNIIYYRFFRLYFLNLANYCDIKYRFIKSMINDIGNIDIEQTLYLIKQIINTYTNSRATSYAKYANNCIRPYINRLNNKYSSLYWKIAYFNMINNDYEIQHSAITKHDKTLYKKYINAYPSIRYINTDIKKYYNNACM